MSKKHAKTSQTVPVPLWVARLAASFLRDHASDLSNNGCNDYTPPEWVPLDALIEECRNHNSDDPNDSGDDIIYHDWIVVSSLASVMEAVVKKGSKK